MGFALYFCVVWKSTSFAHFKSTVWLLYWIFLLSLKQYRLLWLPDLLHAINDFINLSSLLSAPFAGWEVCLLSLYIKSIPKLWSLFLSLFILFPALLDQFVSCIHLCPPSVSFTLKENKLIQELVIKVLGVWIHASQLLRGHTRVIHPSRVWQSPAFHWSWCGACIRAAER